MILYVKIDLKPARRNLGSALLAREGVSRDVFVKLFLSSIMFAREDPEHYLYWR
jgi:hypothetical protein